MKATLTRREGETLVTLEGGLNEHAGDALGALSGSLEGKLVFDWGKVKGVNSLGAGYWIDFLQSIPADVTYRFVNASVGFVSNANAIRPFVGKGKVQTFEVPLYCERCDDSSSVMVDSDQVGERVLDVSPCDKCQGKRCVEIEWESYTAFMNR